MKVICKSLALCKSETPQDASWFQTFPAFGEYPVGGIIPKAREDAVFVFDQEVANAIVAQFRRDLEEHSDWPGILVDREHFSEDPDKTKYIKFPARNLAQPPFRRPTLTPAHGVWYTSPRPLVQRVVMTG